MKQTKSRFIDSVIFILPLLLICMHTRAYGSVIMTGDPAAAPGQTFSFPVLAHSAHTSSFVSYIHARKPIWFVAASQNNNNAPTYVLSYALGAQGMAMLPFFTSNLLPVNGVKNQQNPVYGAGIKLLTLLGGNPAVVVANDPSTLYLFNGFQDSLLLYTAPVSAFPNIQGDLVAIAGYNQLTTVDPQNDLSLLLPGMFVLGAVAPHGGSFGDVGSGLQPFLFARNKDQADELMLGSLPPISLDRTNSLIQITNPVSIFNPVVSLRPALHLKRTFIGLSLVANSGASDGAIAVLVFDYTLATAPVLSPIVSASMVGPDAIVAAQAPSAAVTINSMGSLHSSTGPSYLIVQGGVGNMQMQSDVVYALPLLEHSGMLANVNAAPVTEYKTVVAGSPPSTIPPVSRGFVVPPSAPTDLYSSTSLPAQVGGGPLGQPITDMVVVGDTVFVSTAQASSSAVPGLWQSQALFNASGVISMWTPWRRAGGASCAVPVWGFQLDQRAGTWWIMTGPDVANVRTVQTTVWGQTNALPQITTAVVAPHKGGVQGIRSFARSTNHSSLLLCVGYQTVFMAQTDLMRGGVVAPVSDFPRGFVSVDGSLMGVTENLPLSWISVAGGGLDALGPIVDAALIENGTYGWFIASGAGGVAVLSRPDGSGWAVNPGLQENFAGLTDDMSWKQLPFTCNGAPIQNIIRICFDSGNVYLLAQNGLFMFTPTAELLSGAAPVALTNLAPLSRFSTSGYASYADLFVAGPLAVIAGSMGLLRTGNGVAIYTATDDSQAGWTPVPLPFGPGPAVQIFPVGPVYHQSDAGYDANLYVVGMSVSESRGALFRFAISQTGTITEESMQLFPDEIAYGVPAYYMPFITYQNGIATDGAVFGVSQSSRSIVFAAYEKLLDPLWHEWPYATRTAGLLARQGMPVVHAEPPSTIYSMIQSDASGSWLSPGSGGLSSNE